MKKYCELKVTLLLKKDIIFKIKIYMKNYLQI